MSEMYEKIASLCLERGIKPGKLCADTGLSRGIMSDLKMGRTKVLSAKNTKIIADYLGVTTDYLLGTDEEKEPASQRDELEPMYFSLAKEMQGKGIHPNDVRRIMGLVEELKNDKG